MPLPSPLKKEKETSFIGRCVPLVLEQEGLDKDNEKQRKIAVAICYAQWKKAKGDKAMEIEDLAGLSFNVDGEEVIFEDLIEAYKAHEDMVGEEAGEKTNNEPVKAITKKEKDGGHPAGHYLVVEDSKKVTTWHLRVKDIGGELDHRLMGAAWAALHGGYRGNKYEGPDKAKAIAKLKKLYKQEDMELPGKTLGDQNTDKSLDDLSLDAQTRQVRDAWYEYAKPAAMPTSGAPYPKEVYEDHIIVEMPDGLFKYSYSVADDGAITFGEAVKVELVYKPVSGGKSASYCIKRLGETDTGWYIGGYGMIWGDEKQRDLSPWPNADGSSGEFFTPQTQGLDDLPVKVITFEHDKETGPDGEPFRHVLGTTILERNDAIGRWIEALVEKRRKYANHVVDLIDQQVLNFSSETASHWREVADDGEIKMWRTAGYTTTTHPMEPRLTDVNRLKAYYKSLDLDLAEPDMGGAPEDGGLEMEKAKAKARVLLSRIRKGEVKEL